MRNCFRYVGAPIGGEVEISGFRTLIQPHFTQSAPLRSSHSSLQLPQLSHSYLSTILASLCEVLSSPIASLTPARCSIHTKASTLSSQTRKDATANPHLSTHFTQAWRRDCLVRNGVAVWSSSYSRSPLSTGLLPRSARSPLSRRSHAKPSSMSMSRKHANRSSLQTRQWHCGCRATCCQSTLGVCHRNASDYFVVTASHACMPSSADTS